MTDGLLPDPEDRMTKESLPDLMTKGSLPYPEDLMTDGSLIDL